MKKIYLDVCKLHEPEEAHRYLKEQLNFPDYYGENLDALYDCLTDLHNLEIIFIHANQSTEYSGMIAAVFQDAAKENDTLILKLE